MGGYYSTMTHRTRMALGDEAVDRLSKARVILFGAGALWLKLTTEDQRKAVLGYLIALAVVASIVSLLTGQGPNSAYGFSSSPVQYALQPVPSAC